MDYHVEGTRVCGGELPELLNVAMEALKPLDLAQPPWKVYVVEGLDNGMWGCVIQAHHALGDGNACLVLLSAALFDLDFETPLEISEPKTFVPSQLTLIRRGLRWQGRNIMSKCTNAFEVVSSSERRNSSSNDLRRLAKLAWSEVRNPYRPAAINDCPGGGRVCRAVLRPLDELRTIARDVPGATVNTVFLSAVAQCLERALAAEGMPLESPLRMGVPKRLRSDTEGVLVESATRTGDLVIRPPLAKTNSYELIGIVTENLRSALEHDEPAARAMLGKGGAGAIGPMRWNLTATLVYGPPANLYGLGGRVKRILSSALPGGEKALAVAAFVYDGTVSILVVADQTLAGIVDHMCAGMDSWFGELANAARCAHAAESGRST
ncbi:DUF1298 domain-containing protein [Mycobacterium spongiae]|uniref:diacylglycerol O-acyltransferase n=2 Tax=Mycobacterium spongiae TaxID=886343 RepID=A0A975JXZ0_9MYCO|nr:DUF1298 domain-containing protein [Mycobacterium spongiae]